MLERSGAGQVELTARAVGCKMRTYLTGGKIITPEVILTGKTLVIEDQKILAIEPGRPGQLSGEQVIDASGGWIAPGMIDLHVQSF